MKKCGDCIHAEVCEHNPNIPLFNRANAAYCLSFKDSTNYVEVVRCKDCKHRCNGKDCAHPLLLSYSWGAIRKVKDDDFCSYGERRTDESSGNPTV